MFKVDPISKGRFDAGLAAWIAKTERRVAEVYRGLSVALFNYATFETPQWSGNAAANWNISYGYPSTAMDLSLKTSNAAARGLTSGSRNKARMQFGSPVAQKGDKRAVQVAVGRNTGKPEAIISHRLPVYVTNASTDLDGTSYLKMLEENPNNFLRSVNEPGHMVARGVAKASARFARISPRDEVTLRNLKLGSTTNAGLR